MSSEVCNTMMRRPSGPRTCLAWGGLGAGPLLGALALGMALGSGGERNIDFIGSAQASPAAMTAPPFSGPALSMAVPAAPARDSSSLPSLPALALRRMAIAAQLQQQDELYRQLFDRYDNDRLAFVRALLPRARAGEVQSQRVIALVLDQCADLAPPLATSASPGVPDIQASNAARSANRAAAGCEALNQAPAGEIGTGRSWRARALASGDGRGLIRDAEDRSNGEDGEARIIEFRHALAGSDTQVLREIVSHAGDDQGETGDARTEFEFAVSELAQCKLGADCSSAGTSMEILCTVEDCRGVDSVQRLFELRLSPANYAAANERAQYFADHFLAGNDHWPEAQAFERHLRQIATQQSS